MEKREIRGGGRRLVESGGQYVVISGCLEGLIEKVGCEHTLAGSGGVSQQIF